MTRKPRSHVRILIYWTWVIDPLSLIWGAALSRVKWNIHFLKWTRWGLVFFLIVSYYVIINMASAAPACPRVAQYSWWAWLCGCNFSRLHKSLRSPATQTSTLWNQGIIIGMDFRFLDYKKIKSSNWWPFFRLVWGNIWRASRKYFGTLALSCLF